MSNEIIIKLTQEICKLSKGRQAILDVFLSKEMLILGSYMETRMKCSSPGCHCHKDGGHPTMRISYWEEGKLRNKVVRIDDREWVGKASARYKAHKEALREITRINAREKEVLKSLLEQKAKIYE